MFWGYALQQSQDHKLNIESSKKKKKKGKTPSPQAKSFIMVLDLFISLLHTRVVILQIIWVILLHLLWTHSGGISCGRLLVNKLVQPNVFLLANPACLLQTLYYFIYIWSFLDCWLKFIWGWAQIEVCCPFWPAPVQHHLFMSKL